MDGYLRLKQSWNMRKITILLFVVAALAPDLWGQVDRIELGYQTTRRGIVWYRSGLPTHKPAWKFSRDTNAVMWHDTLTAIRYDFDYSNDVWRAKGTFSGAVPPLARKVSGSTMIDNRTAYWIRDTFNLLHKYDSTANAWTPWGDWFYLSAVPTDISANSTNGAAKYRRSLWQNSSTYEVRYWDGDSWEPFGAVADGSETIVTGANGVLVTGDGTSGNPYVVAPPAGTNTQTLRYSGTTLTANSTLRNDGATVGINSAPTSAAQLHVKQATTTDGIAIQRSSSTSELQLYHGSNATVQSSAGNLDVKATSGQLSLYGPGGGGFVTQIFLTAQSNITAATGNGGLLRFGSTYAPTTAGGDFSFLKFLPAVNQTASANQDIFMVDFNPTLTSVLGQLYGIRYQPSSGRFLWQPNGAGAVTNHLAGNLGIGSGSTSPAQTLHVQGTARISGSDGTATAVVGRDGDGDVSNLALSGLSISGGTLAADDGSATNEIQTYGHSGTTSYTNTLSLSGGSFTIQAGTNVSVSHSGGTVTISATSSADGNGIYGGDDTLPAGGTDVTIPGQWQGLDFEIDASSGQTWTGLRVITDYCNDDAFTKYLVGKSPVDSLEIYNYDCGTWIKETGGQLNVVTDREMYLTADSINITTLPAKTTLRYITGLTDQDYLAKIQGASVGQILKWNGTAWELAADAGGSGTVTGTGSSNQAAFWTSSTAISGDNNFWWDSTNDRLGIGTNAGSVSSRLDVTTNSLGTSQTTTSGIALVNTTAAAAGAQQISPAIRLSGAGWKTNATAASRAVEFRLFVTPVQGAAAPTGYLGIGSAVNGSWSDNQTAFNTAGEVGIGTQTFTGKLNVNAGSSTAPLHTNNYGTSSGTAHTVGQFANTNTAGSALFSLNEEATANTLRGVVRRFGSTHATRARELNVTTLESSAPVTIGTNDVVRMTVGSDANVYVANNLAGGFGTTVTGAHSNVQSAGSMAAGYLETVGSPTFDATKHTVIYTGSTNVTWTLPTASTCTGRWYILHHANTAGTITLSATITKGNGGNFNTLTAGQWAWVVSTGSGWRGYKITSL